MKSNFRVYEDQIKHAILDYIRMFPRKGFAWSQYNGAVYDLKRKCFRVRSKYSRKGVPDINGIWCGLPLYIEVKRPGGVTSPEQKEFIQQALEHDAIAFVCSDLLNARAILDSYPAKNRPPPKDFRLKTET